MEEKNALKSLQKRNDSLKTMLIHEQIKSGNYSFEHFKKYSFIVLNEYKKHQSFFKVSSIVKVSQNEMMNWYIQGQMGNPVFRGFYLAIKEINNDQKDDIILQSSEDIASEEIDIPDYEYIISQYGDGWSYKTYVDGEKIFIISDDLKTLKKKVKEKHLPID